MVLFSFAFLFVVELPHTSFAPPGEAVMDIPGIYFPSASNQKILLDDTLIDGVRNKRFRLLSVWR